MIAPKKAVRNSLNPTNKNEATSKMTTTKTDLLIKYSAFIKVGL